MKGFKDIKWQVVDDYADYHGYSPDTPQIYIFDGDQHAHSPICDMGEIGDMNYADSLAKAHLIAAPPELLRALRGLLASIPILTTNKQITAGKKAVSVINKALNQSK